MRPHKGQPQPLLRRPPRVTPSEGGRQHPGLCRRGLFSGDYLPPSSLGLCLGLFALPVQWPFFSRKSPGEAVLCDTSHMHLLERKTHSRKH